jgi:hypothetical protein
MKNLLLLFLAALFVSISTSKALDYGPFSKKFIVGQSYVMVYFYVPENYDENKAYPVVLGMSPGGGPGIGMRDMLTPIAMEEEIILACPDVGGDILSRALAFCMLHYNVDSSLVICTGYSAGGAAVFPFGVENPEKVKGVIGMAPSIGSVNYDYCTNRPFGLICGTDDSALGASNQLFNGITSNGGKCLFIKKEGVGHIDPYYGGPEFLQDWKQCYNFIKDYVPEPMPQLISPEKDSYAPVEPIELKWKEYPNALKYVIEVKWVTVTKAIDTVESNSYIFDDFKPNTPYSWRVKALSDNAETCWSFPWTFQTKAKQISDPVSLVFPPDSAEDLSWGIALRFENNYDADRFHVQISDDNFQSLVTNDSNVISTGSYEVVFRSNGSLEQGKRYFWKVRAGNREGWGPWSEVSTFTTFSYSSVNDNAEKFFQIYPNPVNDVVNIIGDFEGYNIRIKLFDNLNRKISIYDDNSISQKNEINLDVSDLSSGLYLLVVEYDHQSYVRMFIKSN